MGILPTILNDVDGIKETIRQKEAENASGKTTFKFDFSKNEFVTDVMGNVLTTNDPEEVLGEVVDKILHDQRYKHLIYPSSYGNEIDTALEQDDPFEVLECELKRLYTEALVYHPMIASISDFTASYNGDVITCSFTVTGTNGASIQREGVSKWKRV